MDEEKPAVAGWKAFGAGMLGTLFVAALLAVASWLAAETGASYEGALLVVVVLVLLAILAGYFTAGRTSLLGFVVRLRQEVRILFPHEASEASAKLEDARRTLHAFVLIAAIGFAGIFIYSLQFRPVSFAHVFGSAVVTAIACFAIGVGIGFLFGIPRTLQGDNPAGAQPRPVTPTDANATASAAASAATNGTTQMATAARVATNTNLEQISDWLTKIIVGLGLVNLPKFPGYLGRLLDKIAPYLNHDENLALGIVLGYSVCGFLVSYLLTRLYLAPALVRAIVETDRAAGSDVQKVLNRVAREAAANPAETRAPADGQSATPSEADAASTIEELSKKTGVTEALRKQVDALATEYDDIRITYGPGHTRTGLMEIVASKMRALGKALRGMLPELTTAESAGRRLTAVSFLEVEPNPDFIEWLAERVEKEQPFVGYHAARALRLAARDLPADQLGRVQKAIERAIAAVASKPDSDRHEMLKAAFAEVKKRRGN